MEPPEKASREKRLLVSWVMMVCSLRTRPPAKTQNVVQHLLASHGFLHLHSWVLLLCLLMRLISIGFLGTLFLLFHPNINAIYFTGHHYSKIKLK